MQNVVQWKFDFINPFHSLRLIPLINRNKNVPQQNIKIFEINSFVFPYKPNGVYTFVYSVKIIAATEKKTEGRCISLPSPIFHQSKVKKKPFNQNWKQKKSSLLSSYYLLKLLWLTSRLFISFHFNHPFFPQSLFMDIFPLEYLYIYPAV